MGVHDRDASLTQEKCQLWVTQYLLGQDWRLIEPESFAQEIWRVMADSTLGEEEAKDAVNKQAWSRYAQHLYAACQRADHPQHNRGWLEMRIWLAKQVGRVVGNPQTGEDIVQETLIKLQSIFEKGSLRTPRALWAFALQLLRTTAIDWERKETAEKRGAGQVLNLGGIQTVGQEQENWEERIPQQTDRQIRATENVVVTAQLLAQLRTFFQAHLPSELQRQIAVAHYVDDLSLREIAALLGKTPHEIRQAKARIVKQLRNLPDDLRSQLLEILGQLEKGTGIP
jgi:RNA polymerase sigma factor (sigma-70 family)